MDTVEGVQRPAAAPPDLFAIGTCRLVNARKNNAQAMLQQHEIDIRVRYQETDGQGRLHHANYFTYFEMGRTELLRAAGYNYRKIEEEGWMLVVFEVTCKYRRPASYDDVLRLRTTVERARGARVDLRYEVFRDDMLLAEGRSTLACIDREGRIARLPEALMFNSQQAAE